MVLAKEAGLCYAAVALVTDYDCWRDGETSVSVDDVMAKFKENVTKVKSLLQLAVSKIGARDWDSDIDKLRVILLFAKHVNDTLVN